MLKISDESYERANEILEDIGYVCETSDYYEDWEDIARSSFCVMDDLDADRYNMTCAAFATPHFSTILKNAVTTLNLTATMTRPNFPKMPMRTILTSIMKKWKGTKLMRSL